MHQPDLVLRAIRRDLGVSQRELALMTGVGRSTIARIEGARHDCSLQVYRRIVEAAGFDLVVTAPGGGLVVPDDEHDGHRLRDGRRLPPHLPWDAVRQGDRWWGWFRIAWWIDDPGVPAYTFWQTRERKLRTLAKRNRALDAARADAAASGTAAAAPPDCEPPGCAPP